MQNSINCSVETCKHNGSGTTCTLNSVSVGACMTSKPEEKKETQCASFECHGSMC